MKTLWSPYNTTIVNTGVDDVTLLGAAPTITTGLLNIASWIYDPSSLSWVKSTASIGPSTNVAVTNLPAVQPVSQYGVWNVGLNAGANTIGNVNINGVVPVSAASLPLPTGAATETTLAALNTKMPAQGQALVAGSMPVVIASNQPAITVDFADTTQLDVFARLRVTINNTLFDSLQEYGLDTRLTWDASANGTMAALSSNGSTINGANAVGPVDINSRLTPITVSTTANHFSVLQSRQYVRYVPGKGQVLELTGVLASGAGTAQFVLRTSTSGSVAETVISQASWNGDKLNGTGPSGINLDFTKTQHLEITGQWLGVGPIYCGFYVNKVFIICHVFDNTNLNVAPTTQTFNLPVRLEGRNGATATAFNSGYFDGANGVMFRWQSATLTGGTINFNCCSAQSENGDELVGFPWAQTTGITPIAVTTRRPVMSIRPKATFNGRVNRAHIELIGIQLRTITNDCLYEIVLDAATITGASWVSNNIESAVEYDVSATAITGGVPKISGFSVSGGGTGSNSVSAVSADTLDSERPLTISQIDGGVLYQPTVTLMCTSFTGTSNNSAVFQWHEQTA